MKHFDDLTHEVIVAQAAAIGEYAKRFMTLRNRISELEAEVGKLKSQLARGYRDDK